MTDDDNLTGRPTGDPTGESTRESTGESTGAPTGSAEPCRADLLAGYPDHGDAVRLHRLLAERDPAEVYEELRAAHGPVLPVLLEDDVPAWYVLGYRELRYVTAHPGLFGRDCRRWNLIDRIHPTWPAIAYVTWQPSAAFSEGAERQRRGGAVSDALDAIDRVELAKTCERVADALIDEFAGLGEADLIAQYADRIPAAVIVRAFGLPETEVADTIRDTGAVADGTEEAAAAYERLLDRIRRLVVIKRVQPGDDVTSRLVGHEAGLSDPELHADLLGLIISAHGVNAHWIGNTLRLMLVDDDFSITLQGGRGSVTAALHEVLWREPPLQNLPARFAVQDCELGGRRIRTGDLIVLGFAAANADPQVRPDGHGHPGTNRAHMSFGHGDYGCPFPAPELAEIIAKTAIEVLLDRLPDVALAVDPGELRWRPSIWTRGLLALPVRFTPVSPLGPAAMW